MHCRRRPGGRTLTRATASALALAAMGAAAAPAAHAYGVTAYRYKVVKASHSSSVRFADADENNYTGSSSASWRLGRPRPGIPNAGRLVAYSGIALDGSGQLQLSEQGVFEASASSDLDHCVLRAATGDGEHAALAPSSATISFRQTAGGDRVVVGWLFTAATLRNPYFGTGCTTSYDEPDAHDWVRTYPLSTFRKRTFTLRTQGTGGPDGAYRWSTSVTLKRVR